MCVCFFFLNFRIAPRVRGAYFFLAFSVSPAGDKNPKSLSRKCPNSAGNTPRRLFASAKIKAPRAESTRIAKCYGSVALCVDLWAASWVQTLLWFVHFLRTRLSLGSTHLHQFSFFRILVGHQRAMFLTIQYG